MALAAVITASTGYSACLWGVEYYPDDADLRPFCPPLINPDPAYTMPAPGAVIRLTAPIGGTAVRSQMFAVGVQRSCGSEALVARWFIDRARPCTPNPNNCGQPFFSTISGGDAGAGLRLTRAFQFPAGRCTTVDLYISTAFVNDADERLHEPERAGDIAHARWYVLTADPSGTVVPSITACVQ